MALEKVNYSMHYVVTESPLLIIWICGYCFLRDNLANIVMARSYKFFFKRYQYLIFNEVIKNLATLCALITTLIPVTAEFREIYPIAIGLLWWRLFISYVELNVNLATIMLSVSRVSSNTSIFKCRIVSLELKIIIGITAFLLFLLCFTVMFSEIMKMHYIVNVDAFCSDVNSEGERDFAADLCSGNFFRIFFRGYALIAGDMTIGKFILILIMLILQLTFLNA